MGVLLTLDSFDINTFLFHYFNIIYVFDIETSAFTSFLQHVLLDN